MKISRSQLRRIIKEELQVVLTNEEAGEMFGEEIEELLNEKDEEGMEEGRGDSTPGEVKDYAEKIKKSNPKVDNPFAVAWKTARQPGSKGGERVMGRKKK